MILQAITVCVNYSDFLRISIPLNKKHFDEWVIITSTKCIQSDKFKEDRAAFNRGKMINVGLSQIKRKDWVLLLDADIILPENFKLEALDKSCLYGCGRFICRTYIEWKAFLETKDTSIFQLKRTRFPVGFF